MSISGFKIDFNSFLTVRLIGIYKAFPPDTLITCPVIILACLLARNKFPIPCLTRQSAEDRHLADILCHESLSQT